MKGMKPEWTDRIEHWLRTLKADFYEPLGEVTWKAFQTMAYLSREEAEGSKEFEPVEEGFAWGRTYEYCWFKGTIVLPPEAEGERIVLNLRPGGESSVFVNGEAFGTYRAAWVNEEHHFMEDNSLTRAGHGGDRFQILMETYAGHYYPEWAEGACATGPVLPGAYCDPLTEGERRSLGRCTYGIWNEAAYQLFMDADTLFKLLSVLDEKSLRFARTAEALEGFSLAVDFEQEKPERIKSYLLAAKLLKPALEAVNGSTSPVFYAVGNAHLDLAWLWPIAETCRKTERTFAAQLRLLEEYPEYKFIQSQPVSYEMCRRNYPELFERVKEAIQKGQWIAEGAMWVEPDTNLTAGESLIRQLLYGKRYFKEMFGIDSEILWLPDTFGYSAVLPQLLKGCGVKYLVTQKIFWSYNAGEQFPYHYFNWEGMDGSSIVSFLPTSYTYKTDPVEINTVWKNRVQCRELDSFLLPFGYGDGGGGPSRDYIEYARRQKDLEGGARVKLAGPREFFEDMGEKGGPADTYVGELYFSAHRGTYTSQAMVKKLNRRAETALREAEIWGTAAALKGWNYPSEEMESLWKELLLQHFHDILPGSAIQRVYEEAEKSLNIILEGAEEVCNKALCYLESKEDYSTKDEEAVTVYNSLSFGRAALIQLPNQFQQGAYDINGGHIMTECSGNTVKALIWLPPCGSVTLIPAGEAGKAVRREKESGVSVQELEHGFVMENNQVYVRLSRMGEVESFRLKSSEREFAKEPLNRLRIYKDVPRAFDAWDIDSNYVQQEIPGAYDVTAKVISQGLEAVIQVTGKISKSSYTQYICLTADSRQLRFETCIDWKELHRLLKASFPVNIYTEKGINEIQFGYVERPVHRTREYDKDRFEVCNHRYSALCDGSSGAAVLNDGKYGISMNGNCLELSLLRASASPEMRADNRLHHFTYGFTAWEGGFTECDVVRQGYALNVRPLVRRGKAEMSSFLQIDKENIIMDTMKPAEDGSGDFILRFYESKKASVRARVTLRLDKFKVSLCDMLENVLEELPAEEKSFSLSFGVFEIKTVRITP